MGAENDEETRVITLQASRFNEAYTEQMLNRVGARYGVRTWVRKQQLGWLKRQFTVTIRGRRDRIDGLIEVLDAPGVSAGGGDPGGAAF